MAILLFDDARGKTREFVLPEDRNLVSIGSWRATDNDIALEDPMVSRKHCLLERKDGNWHVRDAGSRFGTSLNGETLAAETRLSYEDAIKVGATTLRFLDVTTGAFSTGAPAPAAGESLESVVAELRALSTRFASAVRDPALFPALTAGDAARLVERVERLDEKIHEVNRTQLLGQTLSEVGKLINLVTDLPRVLKLTMDMAVRALGAERGYLLLEEGEVLKVRLAHNMGDPAKISTTIAEQTFREGREILTTDAQSDERFQAEASVVMQAIRAVMCVPLKSTRNKPIGVLYVDGRPGSAMFTARGLDFLIGFASQASIAIENAQLEARSVLEERRRQKLSTYFAPAVLEAIMHNPEVTLGGTSRIISALFTDVRGFTALAERLTPEEAVELLNDYFTEIVDDLYAEDGTLDKYTGDGLMAFWNAPLDQPDHALRAVRAALQMQARVPALIERWAAEKRSFVSKLEGFGVGIGIHTGAVIVGNIGSPKRTEYTAIGDSVNVSARVQGLAKTGEVLITLQTLEHISAKVRVTPLPPVTVKGKSAVIQVFRVEGLR